MLTRELMRTRSLSEAGRCALRSGMFRGGALSLLVQMQFMAVQLVTGVILARILGPTDFGLYSFAFAIVTLIQVMPNSGLDNVVVRYSAQYHAQRSWSRLRGLWRAAGVTSAAYGFLSAASVVALFALGWLPTTAALSPSVLVVAAIPMFLLPMLTCLGAALRAVSPGVVGQLPQFAVRPAIYLLLILAVVGIVPNALTAARAMWLQGVAAFATTLVGAFWLFRRQPQQLRNVRPIYEVGRWLRSASPLFLAGGLMLINTQADLLILGILGTAHEVGLFKVAANGAGLVVLSLTAANLYIAPRISAMYVRGEKARLQRLLSLSVRSTFAIAIVVACVFALWGRDLLGLVFGKSYLEAFRPLLILCVGQLINVGAGSVGLVLSMTGHEGDAAAMAGVAAGANIGLNFALIPAFGGVGAAASTAITMLIWNSLMLTRVRQKTGLDASIFSLRMA